MTLRSAVDGEVADEQAGGEGGAAQPRRVMELPRDGIHDAWTSAILAGDFVSAWAVSDAVLRARNPAERDDPTLPYHRRWVWDGRSFDGRDVLVRCYHGLGDTLQFCRYLPTLRRRAARVTLEVQPALVALLAGMADAVVGFDPAAPLPPRECDIEIMELAHALRLAPCELAAPPYLRVAGAALPPAIGVCWEPGTWDRSRSVRLEGLLAALPDGVPLVSLQRGEAAAEAVSGRFLNPGDADCEVVRTAELVAGVLVVVTVDTMVAHLTGALGRPGVVVLKRDADWRWMHGERSAWYPSLRLVRPGVAGYSAGRAAAV